MKYLPVLVLAASSCLPAATLDGAPIHFTASGSGPTVIFVHGWTCDETSWSAQVPALQDRFRVVTIDLPGHGKSGSPKTEKLSMPLFARAVEAVRAEVGADRVVLVGHSMGTPVIVQYARMYPNHTAALVFVDGVVTLGKNLGRKPNTASISGPNGLKAREANTRTMFSAATTPELQARILKMMDSASEATAVQAMEAMYDPAIWKDDVIDIPVQGIFADRSGLNNVDYMKEHFSRLSFAEIPGTGHFLMMEKPAEFNRILLGFLEQQKF